MSDFTFLCALRPGQWVSLQLCPAHKRFMACGQHPGPCFVTFSRGGRSTSCQLTAHYPCAQHGRPDETPEKLCKCKGTNPSPVTRGQAEKEQSVRGQEPAAGEGGSVGVAHLQGHHCPGSGSLTRQGVTHRKRGWGLVSPACSGLSSWSVGHCSVLTLIIRLAGRKESGCNM